MAKVILEVQGKHYSWDCQEGITGAGLKDLIGKRTAGSVLYHTKLRFLSDKGAVTDDDKVPLSPASVKVQGPGSVVQMLGLFCQKDGKAVAPQPKPKAVLPAPDRQVPSGLAPSRSMQADRAITSTSRSSPGMTSGYTNSGGFQPPRYTEPFAASFGPTGQTSQTDLALQELAIQAEEQGLQQALAASTATVQADEEAQLRWALEESARMAEDGVAGQSAEEIQKFYLDQQASKASSSTTDAAAPESALFDSEDEGFAWDSGSEDEAGTE
eukprot:CAMPEP_0197632514 /NCGR_PEP_ID=MMETSP1338-20131121/9228_1 /TAXON_ID=43686 ORGANISM="Pelagodinium beii, Strain RCC1491" /NCGR_SAMPLE_ID=MMETSP1338 /ASSEMBLY_ACC=CAM_ASM_000754 /LENGTH=269 /DNA_ID=CAMNT_0043204077 /DNA_START=45 /DNA_END=854 /DNA_ORIENTATION=+